MKSSDLQKKFGVAAKTIQRWSNEFEEYLSDKKGRQRIYSMEDLIIIATIHQLSSKGMTYEAIHQELASGYRVDVDDIDTMGYPDGRMVPAAVVEQVIESSEMRAELERMTAERDYLQRLLEEERVKLSQRDTEVSSLHEEIKRLNERIFKLMGGSE